MGLGGALLAGVRHVMRGPGNGNGERRIRRNTWGFPGAVIMRWDPFDFFGDNEDHLGDLNELPFFDDAHGHFGSGSVRNDLERAFERRHGQRPSEPDYKPEYTHPNKPPPGFTHDFAPATPTSSPLSPVIVLDDSPGPSSADSSGSRPSDSILACACCHDPLILGACDVGEGRDQRKLWGLRCGHLLDGKCVQKLMKSTPPPFQGQEFPQVDVKGKGKMIAEPGVLPSFNPDGAVEDDISDPNPMRSRLRPRRGIPGSFPSAPDPAHSSPSNSSTSARLRGGTTTGAHTGHRSKAKGKGKAKVPVVEAEHEWSCPVSGCGHVHLSLLVDGRWTMDEKRGAIAVFV